MGTLRAKTIEPATGSTLTLGASGDTITVSSDSIKVNTFKDAGGNTLFTSDGAGTLSSVNSGLAAAGPVLLSTSTASGASSIDITSGITSTYDEYMFVFTDINPATDNAHFQFQVNATDDAGGGYDTSLITSTYFRAEHYEDDSATGLAYRTGEDLAQSASFQILAQGVGNGADESCAGIMHLFNPSSTTYVKHFYARFSNIHYIDLMQESYVGGYINDTTAIDAISFKMSSGNFDGVIQMYGIK